MNISYPMICQACSTNDRLSESQGMRGVFEDIGIDWPIGQMLTEQGGVRALFRYVREQDPPKHGMVLYRDEPLNLTERQMWDIFFRTWVDGFVEGVDLEQNTEPGLFSQDCPEGIDAHSTKSAAEQRVLRVMYLLVRKEPVGIGQRFVLREEAVSIWEGTLSDQIKAVWVDGFTAGVRAEKKRVTS